MTGAPYKSEMLECERMGYFTGILATRNMITFDSNVVIGMVSEKYDGRIRGLRLSEAYEFLERFRVQEEENDGTPVELG